MTVPPSTSAAATPQTVADTEPSIGDLASEVTTHLSTLVRSEIALAKLELKTSVRNAGITVGLFVGAGVLVVFALIFGFFALAEGIAAAGLPRWAGFLIVFGFLIGVAVGFVFLGKYLVKTIRKPERTMRTTRETVDYLKKSRA